MGYAFNRGKLGMIRIVREDSPEGFRSLFVQGHAGYDVKGQDVVCAAVSVLTQAWMTNLREALGRALVLKVDAEHARIRATVPRKLILKDRVEIERMAKYFFRPLVELAQTHPEHVVVSEVSSGEALELDKIQQID